MSACNGIDNRQTQAVARDFYISTPEPVNGLNPPFRIQAWSFIKYADLQSVIALRSDVNSNGRVCRRIAYRIINQVLKGCQ